jgi:hypothetical protein
MRTDINLQRDSTDANMAGWPMSLQLYADSGRIAASQRTDVQGHFRKAP